MRDLFPTKTFRFFQYDEDGTATSTWSMPGIDLTANVVCKPCNEGWMSNLESQRAKPAMTDLILGDKHFRIRRGRAHSLAIFAFKTAVIVNHMDRVLGSFFPRSVRYEFARSLTIPRNVAMWFCGFVSRGSGRVAAFYPEGRVGAGRIKLYVCTYSVGHLVFQVVAGRTVGVRESLAPADDSFEGLSIPFWPSLPLGHIVRWPPPLALGDRGDFNRFAERWGRVRVF